MSDATRSPEIDRPSVPPTPPPPAASPPPARRRLPRPLVWGVAALALAGAGVGGFRYVEGQRDFITTNNAYVRGDILTVGAKIPGRLQGMYVRTGDAVRPGQLLGELDATEIAIQLRQAEANLAAARAALGSSVATVTLQQAQTVGQEAQAAAGVQAALRQADAARVAAGRAAGDFGRLSGLYREGGVSRQQYDAARASMETTSAQVRAAEAQVGAARAAEAIARSGETQVAVRRKAVEASEAQIAQAEAAVAAARQQLANTKLLSPVAGVVAKKNLMGGEMVQPGQAIAEVVDPASVYVEAMIDETAIARVRPGEPVRVDVDAYPHRPFQGTVALVGAATGSEFALMPQNNASGNFTKVVQRLPVKIAVENPDQLLKPGMSAQIAIDVRPAR